MKKLLTLLSAAEKETEKVGDLLSADPENAELESKWEDLYRIEYALYISAAYKVVEMTSGKIDLKTAKTMVDTKRAELEKLFA